MINFAIALGVKVNQTNMKNKVTLNLVITSVMQLLSRHSEFSIILITQNLYEQGRECRNIR